MKKSTPLRRFLAYVKPYRWLVAGAAVAGIFKFCLPLTFPLALKYITDVILGEPARPGHPGAASESTNQIVGAWVSFVQRRVSLFGRGPTSELHIVALTMVVIYLALAGATYYRSYLAGKAGHRLIFDLRYALYLHIQRLSHSFFERRQSGAIVSRFVSDIALAQNFVGSALTNVWMDGASLVFVIALLFILQWQLALVALTVIPFYVFIIRYFSPRIKEASHSVQEQLEDFSGELQEKIAGVSVVKSFAQEHSEAKRFYRSSRQLYDTIMRNVRLSSWNSTFTDLITKMAPLVVVWVASVMILRGRLTVGTLIAFFAYVGALYLPLQRFSELGIVISNSVAAIERIFEFFDVQPEVKEDSNAVLLPPVRGEVIFENVSFAYDQGLPVLHHVNVRVKPGEVVALVGQSGSGKTTLVSLIPRFYDVTEGRILIDGVDIRKVTLKSLRDQIGMVLQDTILFSGTLRENLRYGNPKASDAELLRAAQAANAHEFIESLPEGYDTLVGERGIRLSGGQRQRVAIARAFLKNPRILILDEATSALDSESENLIHEALSRLMKGRTTFIIAHRLSTVMNADKLVVLHDGRVVEVGTHEELLRRGGYYSRLFEEQFKDFRLDAFREEVWRFDMGERSYAEDQPSHPS